MDFGVAESHVDVLCMHRLSLLVELVSSAAHHVLLKFFLALQADHCFRLCFQPLLPDWFVTFLAYAELPVPQPLRCGVDTAQRIDLVPQQGEVIQVFTAGFRSVAGFFKVIDQGELFALAFRVEAPAQFLQKLSAPLLKRQKSFTDIDPAHHLSIGLQQQIQLAYAPGGEICLT